LKLPKEVLVGSQPFAVIERTPETDGMLGEAYAYTLVESNLIVVRRDLPAAHKRKILVHELLHAVIFTFGRSDRVEKNDNFDDWEHHFITMTSEPLVMLVRNNPDLVGFLLAD
jgi:hypothetical protein